MLLFGGQQGNSPNSPPLSDTWIWDEDKSQWVQGPSGKPTPRYSVAMAPARNGSVLLFGGNDGSGHPGYLNDTWLWNGNAWGKPSVSGPPMRERAAMAYDESTGDTFLFGGYDGHWLSDTWSWANSQWRKRQSDGQGPSVTAPYLIYDANSKATLLLGGTGAGQTAHTGVWRWNGNAWTPVTAEGPDWDTVKAVTVEANGDLVLLGVAAGADDSNSAVWTLHISAAPKASSTPTRSPTSVLTP